MESRTILRRSFLFPMLTFFMVLSISCVDSGDSALQVRFPQAVNAMHPRVIASNDFGNRLSQRTNGRIITKIFPGGQLYGARQAVQAAALGDIEMAMEPETHFIMMDDSFRAVDIPFLFENEVHFRKFLDGPFRDRVEAKLKDRGLVLLALWDEGPMVLAAREKLLREPANFVGTKIRSSGHDLLARSWNALGAATIRLPIEEVYTALQQGVTDAIYTTLYTFVAGKFYEVAPKAVVWPSRATYVWVVNQTFWNGLNPPDRVVIRELVKEATSVYYGILKASLGKMERTVREAQDGELVSLTLDEESAFLVRIESLIAEWNLEYAAALSE